VRALFFLLIPFIMLGLWSLWNIATYGAPHLTESSKRVMQTFSWTHLFTFLTFLAGVTLLPLAAWARRGLFFRRFVFPSALAFAVFLASPLGGYTPLQAFLLAFFSFGGALFYAQALEVYRQTPVRSDRFLLIWLLLGTVQMIAVMQWVAARYYLTMLPPVVFLAYRWAQLRYRHFPSALNRFQTVAAAVLLLVGFSSAWADYRQAETSRLIVQDTARDNWLAQGRRCFFLGDSFTGSYLKCAGWLPAFEDTPLEPGDLVLHQEVIMPRWWFRVSRQKFRLVKTYEYSCRFPVRVMDNQGAAGFYASAWGALPYTISKSPLEKFSLLEVTN
jgi:hypothetical protein